MAYTDVISLVEAKSYLGVDDTSRDTEITRMIGSALSYLEKRTNIIMYARDKVYTLRNGCVRVYDYPINTLDENLASTVTKTVGQMYDTYSDSNTENKTITLNVGSSGNIPPDLIEAGYMLIEYYFNMKEVDMTRIPVGVELAIGANRRFTL